MIQSDNLDKLVSLEPSFSFVHRMELLSQLVSESECVACCMCGVLYVWRVCGGINLAVILECFMVI